MPTGQLPPKLERFLEAPNVAVVATVGADGAPSTAATWYEYRDGRLVLPMLASARRVEELRANPGLGLTVLAPDWYSQLSLTGTAVDIREDPGLEALDRMAMRYDGEPYAHSTRDQPFIAVTAEISRWHTFGDPAAATADTVDPCASPPGTSTR
jgi:PPOX class probable F420-dependent enzyme